VAVAVAVAVAADDDDEDVEDAATTLLLLLLLEVVATATRVLEALVAAIRTSVVAEDGVGEATAVVLLLLWGWRVLQGLASTKALLVRRRAATAERVEKSMLAVLLARARVCIFFWKWERNVVLSCCQ
jgi:hypothetical protein